jgi:hypothetical protein
MKPTLLSQRVRRAASEDALLAISPRVYVERLLGTPVRRDGKVRCPFHDPDRTPSLHAYEDPQRGWYCFSCGRGGSIYDFAAPLLGRGTRGDEFIDLRRELMAMMLGRPALGRDMRDSPQPGAWLVAAEKRRA